jgi:D-alanyl-D-alanine carboxypeptidase (penicillin-binding protein 5/6)
MALGTAIAAGLIVAMQLPLMNRPSTFTTTMGRIAPAPGTVPPLAWPSTGSAALVVPAMGVAVSWHDHVVPIASLTKMMTAYVTLKALPLALGANGPCVTVKANDVAVYQQMAVTDQSSAAVALGEQLCEFDLLDGLLVHSAGNYAMILANMVSGSSSGFVDLMNSTAASLGLSSTRYADESGFSPESVSNARDQATLAEQLMESPVVRSIVIQPTVTLPVAGNVGSYTPYVGIDHVIGVKSGRTAAAGGCDVMAMSFLQGGQTRIIYSVVLGQRGPDVLKAAGDAALALANSALANRLHHIFLRATVVGKIGWGTYSANVVLARQGDVYWWAAQGHLGVRVVTSRLFGTIHRGQRVGWLVVRGLDTRRFALVAARTVSAPTIWQRLR